MNDLSLVFFMFQYMVPELLTKKLHMVAEEYFPRYQQNESVFKMSQEWSWTVVVGVCMAATVRAKV